jgi:hypothetical protein
MASKAGTKYGCPHCEEKLTIFVMLSEPPLHLCEWSNKYLPLLTPKEIKEQKGLARD